MLLLKAVEQNDPVATEELLELVYDELRRLAAQKIAREGAGNSLQGTALVHEAYLRLVDADDQKQWDSRGHFFAAAAEAMRRILVERARKRKCLKHGGERSQIPLDDYQDYSNSENEELLAISDALDCLKEHDAQAHQLVMLRYFGGLQHQEAAAAMGLSRRVADRIWAVARVWLHEKIREN